MPKFLLLLLLLLSSQLLSAKDNNVTDSLLTEYELTKDPLKKIDILNELATNIYKFNQQLALTYTDEAFELSKEQEYKFGEAKAYLRYGIIYHNQRDFPKAMLNFIQSLEIFKELEYKKGISSANNNIGLIYQIQHMYAKALEHFLIGLQINEEIENKKGIAHAYNNIGTIFLNRKDYDKAETYFNKSLKIKLELKDDIGVASSFNNLGNIYLARGEWEKAMSYYLEALKLNKKNANLNWIAKNYTNIGLIQTYQRNYDSALYYLKKAILISSQINDNLGICDAYILQGNIYNNLGKLDSSETNYHKAYKLGLKHNYHAIIQTSADKLSKIYSAENNVKKAFSYYIISRQSQDSLIKSENINNLYKLEFQYQLSKEIEQHKIEQWTKELQYKNHRLLMLIGLAITIIISIMIIIFLRYQIRASRLKNKIATIEQARLNEKIEYNNKELVNFALHIIQKNELIELIKHDIKEILNANEKERLPKARSLYMQVYQSTKANEDFKKFQQRTEEVNAVFIHKLDKLYPTLTPKEKRLSVLLRLNFSTKEISALTNISSRSVEVNRSRLRKKINIDSAINLAKYFQSL